MEFIETSKAPKPIGPYSQGITENGMVFVSGMIGLDPSSNKIVEGGIREQTERVMENLKAVLAEAGSSLRKVVRATVYIKEAAYFKEMNEVYAAHFEGHKPTRSTIVCGFARDEILVEIDAIATR